MLEYQPPHRKESLPSRPSRILDRLAAAALLLGLPSSLGPTHFDARLPYDAPVFPTASARPFPVAPSTPKEPSTICLEGTPVRFHSPDMGIYDAPVEQVGNDTKGTSDQSDDSPAAPNGRDKAGAYNTVGWYKFGPKPGAEQGTPVFLAHSTRIEDSLLPREEYAFRMKGIRDIGGTVTFIVTQDNGSNCEYEVQASGMWLRVDKKKDYRPLLEKIYVGRKGREPVAQSMGQKSIFVTCAGLPNIETGSSSDATVLLGELTN